MTERDSTDLARADELMTEGRRLRSRVLSRIRVRNMRARRANPTKETE